MEAARLATAPARFSRNARTYDDKKEAGPPTSVTLIDSDTPSCSAAQVIDLRRTTPPRQIPGGEVNVIRVALARIQSSYTTGMDCDLIWVGAMNRRGLAERAGGCRSKGRCSWASETSSSIASVIPVATASMSYI